MNDGLKDKYRQTLIDILAANPRVERVVLFGSRAMSTHSPESDIDLALYGDNLTFDDLSKLKARIEETTIPQQVDLVLAHGIDNKKLLAHIREHGVEWFRRGRDCTGGGMGEKLSFGDAAELIRNTVQPDGMSDMPYVGLEHIEEGTLKINGHGSSKDVKSTKFLFKKGDILFGKLRPYFRKIVRAPFDGICSTDIWVVRSKNGVDQGYLYYWMAAPDFVEFATSGSEGTRMPRAKWEHVSRFTRAELDIDDQRTIAHILGTLDDKIELNRQMNRTLEAMAQALFKSWFIDFDPVVVNALRAGNPIPERFAERAAHYRDNPNALRLPEGTLCQFPDRFQDSELGPIPEGWRVGIVSDLATVTSGKRPKKRSKEKNVEFRIPLYGGGGIMAYVKEPLVTEPLLLTGRVGTLGMIFRISEPCWPSDNTLILFPKDKIHFHFLFFMLQLIDFGSLNRGSTQPLVTQTDLNNQSLVIPDAKVSNLFWVNVYPLFEKIDKNLEEISVLSSLRDTLLPKLISGELRVPDADKLLEDAL
ncbi:MAG TPA: restriction endonuclease subunit S [Methylothermaceae bacterium]|nr:restriction endonuclease subunit S [Methylothermaceae bacterium]